MPTVIVTKASSETICDMDKEHLHGQTKIAMKVNGKTTREMAKVH